MLGFLTKIFGSYQERTVKKLFSHVDGINQNFERFLQEVHTPDDFKRKTEEFRARLRKGETTDELLPEAFGLVKRVAYYLKENKILANVTGHQMPWEMVPFDVQLIGGIVIHSGKISEMATGEGKTLVATMPAYLNALNGQVHVVTVNDYLALRDSQWMGLLYTTLGVTVGCLQGGMDTEARKSVYQNDIVYGTNSEFGFDYLRDNMVGNLREQVQKYREFAIIDEVDSILIDEARTPLIISGPVQSQSNRYFRELNPKVRRLLDHQRELVSKLVREGQEAYESGDFDTAAIKFLIAYKGLPTHKQLMKLRQETKIQRLMNDMELVYIRDKRVHELEEELYYVIDEKRHVADLAENGRKLLSPENPKLFELTDIGDEFARILEETQDETERENLKRKVQRDYSEKNEILHALSQLLRAYSLFEKDVDYVVQENKVLIVDEFTGRLMPGRRFSDGLHNALEAKENVQIEGDTQTFATITLQNFFRMYKKISGMTGTAVTEAGEFKEIYKMDVLVVPTNRPVRRMDYDDVIYKTKKEKFNAVIDEIHRVNQRGQPVLVGTVSVEDSELLARMLTRKGLIAEVLNAKNHQKEAEIVARAGQKGSITIATNMAGRGTDIKLGAGVKRCVSCALVASEEGVAVEAGVDVRECKRDVPCGLYVIGTERHESRRIDRQLRGRSGRQGDPGASRFFVSLEDNLMRLFGSDRIIGILDRLKMEDGEAIQHPLISRQIENAQKRVEHHHFQIRKHTLEYDDVMNKQRFSIYDRRNSVLEAVYLSEFIAATTDKTRFASYDAFRTNAFEKGFERVLFPLLEKHSMIETEGEEVHIASNDLLEEQLTDMIAEVVEEGVDMFCPQDLRPMDWDLEGLKTFALEYFGLFIDIDSLTKCADRDALNAYVNQEVEKLAQSRDRQVGADIMRDVQRIIMLSAIDRNWREHLYAIDNLMEGINLRAYAQKDPLFEYKKESYEMFHELEAMIRKQVIRDLFHLVIEKAEQQQDDTKDLIYTTAGNSGDGKGIKRQPIKKNVKVGRNDPCPCGSGKKYKTCCWPKYGE